MPTTSARKALPNVCLWVCKPRNVWDESSDCCLNCSPLALRHHSTAQSFALFCYIMYKHSKASVPFLCEPSIHLYRLPICSCIHSRVLHSSIFCPLVLLCPGPPSPVILTLLSCLISILLYIYLSVSIYIYQHFFSLLSTLIYLVSYLFACLYLFSLYMYLIMQSLVYPFINMPVYLSI